MAREEKKRPPTRASQSRQPTQRTRSAGGTARRVQQRQQQTRLPAGSQAKPRNAAHTQQPPRGERSLSQRAAQQRSSSRPPQKKRPPQRRKPRRRLRWGRIVLLMAVVLVCVALGVWAKGAFFTSDQEETQVPQSVSTPLVSDADKAGFDASINSDSAILINADNGDVLYEKDADTQRAPASLVKMMTVYTAIRNNDDIDREIEMPAEAYEGLEDEKASQSGLQKGDTVTIRDLLYATLLRSGADAANALAIETSGDTKSFVELMNKEAKSLGLDSTNFTNPIGLDNAKQVSTCRDMARLVKQALGDTIFNEVFTSRSYTTTEGLALTHTMDEDLPQFQRYFDTSGYEIIGGKTGYTEDAGNCLASLAQKDGDPSYIVVTMHATGKSDQYYQAVHDAVTLYGEAYDK